uniref:pro-neuregulin-1, membrane-bound isoform isoform X1 n=1 Tax=Monopterus albus TaxID=43700 RepID=UPI0009B30F5F|nr:pro-neuregulin-1, membrane-bound isoform-like isoform X1 [Monopterus albus]XP_020456625.1 pro-neuregulin-1, membrane-bound isoform-like isoform X1 [Monopterus albus]XP_020456626.1 pro-neuregulin-1, membrane-bound isoform-like isoform X1 [Monopterus albus]
MTEGMEDISAVPAHPSGSASPTSSTVDTGQVPKEKPEETEAAGESGEDGAEETAEGGGGGGDDGGDGEHLEALGIVALPGTCCVCIEMEQINNCLHSEKICILPILACLLSLALCIAGLKWVFVDKIFEYEPPTHLDPKPIGQDPIIISVDPTLGLTVSVPHSSPSTASLTTAITVTPGHPEVFVEEESTRGPYVPQSPRVTQSDPSVTLKYNADHPTNPKQTQHPRTTQEYNDIIIPTISATSTTTTARTSSHVTRCRDSQKNYCVNGGECFTLEIMPGSTKFLCRCPNEFTGDRCQNYVMASFYKAEELYQKRILTITGICIALLVVGIMCVVAYCKTKKQRKKLHDRLRQSLRKKRNNNTNTGTGPNSARGRQISNLPLQDLQLINQCNGMTMQHADEKETETTFSTSKYALCAHEPTTLTHISSQRFVSAMRSPTQLSPVSQISPETPGSPPSELSAPLSSLAISVPSVALSLSGEEERPLLLSNGHPPHKPLSRDEQKRNSAHYNHGHMAHSLPPSPLFTMENVNYQIIGDGDTKAAGHMFSEASEKLINTNNINDRSNKKTGVTNGHVLHNVDSSGDNKLVSETLEPRREHTPFLTTDNTTALLIRVMDSRRTNPASPNDSVQVK